MADDNYESAFTQAASQPPEPVAQVPPPAAPPIQPGLTQSEQAPPATPAAPVQPVQPAAPSTPTPNPLLEMARQAGFQIGDNATPEEVARLAIQQVQSLSPMAQYAQQLLPHAAEFQKFLEAQQTQQTQAPTEEWTEGKYFDEQWGSQWDSKYSVLVDQGMVQRDPNTGLWTAAPGYEYMVAGVLPAMNEAQHKQTQNWQAITRGNPYQHFYEKLQEPMRRAWQADMEKAIQQQFTQLKQESALEQFEKTNADWLYSQQNGQRNYSPHGQKFIEAFKTLHQGGITDQNLLLTLAAQIAGAPSAAPAQAVPTVQNPVAASDAQQKSFLQNAIDRSGHSAGSVADPLAPVNVEETDLNSMFVSALRTSQGQGALARTAV